MAKSSKNRVRLHRLRHELPALARPVPMRRMEYLGGDENISQTKVTVPLRAARYHGRLRGWHTGGGSKKINDVETTEAEKQLTGIGELDRVLCGGVTTGSVNIISGDPGAGKTTLLSDLVARMSKCTPSLYCTAEESLSQFKNRVHRLKAKL